MAVAVEEGHGEVNDTTVAPPATRVEEERVGKRPQLGGDAVEPIPVVEAHSTKPELAPCGNTGGTTYMKVRRDMSGEEWYPFSPSNCERGACEGLLEGGQGRAW